MYIITKYSHLMAVEMILSFKRDSAAAFVVPVWRSGRTNGSNMSFKELLLVIRTL
jgi:hypothetical protein